MSTHFSCWDGASPLARKLIFIRGLHNVCITYLCCPAGAKPRDGLWPSGRPIIAFSRPCPLSTGSRQRQPNVCARQVEGYKTGSVSLSSSRNAYEVQAPSAKATVHGSCRMPPNPPLICTHISFFPLPGRARRPQASGPAKVPTPVPAPAPSSASRAGRDPFFSTPTPHSAAATPIQEQRQAPQGAHARSCGLLVLFCV